MAPASTFAHALAPLQQASSSIEGEGSQPENAVGHNRLEELTWDRDVERRVAQLIRQLAAPSYPARVNARWELERIGLAAFGQLREAMNDPNIQIANAARYIVESQNVIWWLTSDSTTVRQILDDYNDLERVDRETRMERLGDQASEDALLALCRLARFESDDGLSKLAALVLMETVAKNQQEVSDSLPRSMRLTLGESQRSATGWLLALADELDDASTDQIEPNVEAWKDFLVRVHGELDQQQSVRSRGMALRLYKWVGAWLTQHAGRDTALTSVRPSLELIDSKPYSVRRYVLWALDAGLPELVQTLHEKQPQAFESEAEVLFLLAESYRVLGNSQRADAFAEEAADTIDEESAQVRRFRQVNANDVIANRHKEAALRLAHRGLFDWAEQEYLRALNREMSANFEIQIRSHLAEFYWTGGENQKAAVTLKPLAENPPEAPERELPGRSGSAASLLPYYYYYQGLAEIDAGHPQSAFDWLKKSIELEPNPDVVIAMYQIADEASRRSEFESYYKEMVEEFRVQVAQAEQVLSESGDRMARASITYGLASACNQLAWLLSNCERSPQEAINLSQRSLEFDADNPAFLDTLGRCYYAAGRYEEAIEAQQRAVDLMPHDRMMKRQLDRFVEALENAPKKSQKRPSS